MGDGGLNGGRPLVKASQIPWGLWGYEGQGTHPQKSRSAVPCILMICAMAAWNLACSEALCSDVRTASAEQPHATTATLFMYIAGQTWVRQAMTWND